MSRKRKQNKKFDHYFQMHGAKGLYYSGKILADYTHLK